MDKETWSAVVYGVKKSWTRLSDWSELNWLNIKGEIDKYTILLEEYNILLASVDRSSRKKISKAAVILNDTIDQMDSIRHWIPKKQNKHSFQVYMKCSTV